MIEFILQKMTKAFVAGATGETGSQLVKQLLENDRISKVKVIARQPLELSSDKLEVKVMDDFNQIKASDLAGCEIVFSALGTTRAKSNAEQYRIIDHDYPVHIAAMAKEAGCRYFGLVSSTGASASSWFTYPKMKAETEADCTAAGPPSISIFRPGFLVCDRKERRVAESIGLRCLVPLLNFFAPGRYAVETKDLASFMINDALNNDTGHRVYENHQIK